MEENNNKKRILHVIRVVYDILSALFIVFVSSALVINALSRGDKQKQDILTPNIQEVKSRENYYKTPTGYYYYSTSDLLSATFIEGFIDYLVDNGYSWASQSSTSVGTWDLTNISDTYDVLQYNSNNGTSSQSFSPYYMHFEKATWDTSYIYRLSLANTGYSKVINFEYSVIKNSGFNLWNFGVSFDYVTGATMGNISHSLRFVLTEDSSSSKAVLWPIFYNAYLGTYENGYDKGYLAGQDVGYLDGYNDGRDSVDTNTIYQNGYGTGYNQGFIDGSEGIESNVFTVIGQAFGSVAQVFSIELLPGLPLWILVFTPLIISVVIVVVKMIKG